MFFDYNKKFVTAWFLPFSLLIIIVLTNYFSNIQLFHFISEFFAILVALGIGFISYYTYHLTQNRYLLYLGIGYANIGILDTFHTLTFPGMNIFEIDGPNATLTFWVLTRIFEAMILLSSVFMRNVMFDAKKIAVLFFLITTVIALISLWFPLLMFDKTEGLTSLKNGLEYSCIFILLVAMFFNKKHLKEFNISVYNSIQFSIIFTILAEFSFTAYLSLSGIEVVLGHAFKFISFWIIFESLLKVSLMNPIALLEKNLKNKTEKLQNKQIELEKNQHQILLLNENLEQRVKEEIQKNEEKEKLLFQQSKMAAMGEMIENIAHQWKQPLSVISTAASGVTFKSKMEMLKKEDIEVSMNHIGTSVQHLSTTIDDFRDFFKVQREGTTFTIGSAFEKTFKLTYSEFKNSNINIEKNIDQIPLFGLENELIQVLINILNNARDALIKEKEIIRVILINASVSNSIINISIKDNAGGITLDILDEVFNSHFTTKSESNGTGIGLYMSKMIIDEHMNGSIKVRNSKFIHNTIPCKGAEFIIQFPQNIDG